MGIIQCLTLIRMSLHGKRLCLIRFKHIALLPVILLLALTTLSACAPDTGILGAGNWQAGGLIGQHLHALAVDPNNPQTLYTGDTQGAISVSTDAGLHWVQRSIITSSPTLVYNLTFNSSGKKLYALADVGLFASTNAARQWSTVTTSRSSLPSDGYTTITFASGQQAYVGSLHHGIFMSNDDGVIWQSANGNLPRNVAINDLIFDPIQHRLWAATSIGVYLSENAGTSWLPMNDGLPSNNQVATIQVASVAGGAQNLIYAGTDKGVFRSLDAGMHWMTSGQALQGVDIHRLLLDFRSTNASTIYAGTNVGVFRSDDNGQNWRGVAGGLPRDVSVYALAIGASNASQLYATANGVYLFPGTNSGLSPSRIITLLLIALLFFLLYLIAQRGIRRRRNLLKPERIIESSAPATKEP